jgi:hypothetical protein
VTTGRLPHKSVRTIDLKSALREQLLIFFQWARPVHSDVSYIELFTLPQALKGITKELEEQGKLTDVQPYFLRSFAGREVSSLEALLPVAAGIDERHLRCWGLIINNLKGIRDSKSDEELFRALIDFLGFTIEFVELKI